MSYLNDCPSLSVNIYAFVARMANALLTISSVLFFTLGLSLVVVGQVEYATPWKKGTNICAYVTRPGILDYKLCTHCLPWKMEYGKKNITFKYDCCPGFLRSKRFGNKCVEREKTWKLIPGLLREQNFKKFADLITHPKKGAGYKDIDDKKSPNVYTTLAPYSNKALNDYKDIDYDQYKGEKKHPVLFHVVKGRIYMKDFRNGMMLKSEYDGDELKVTKYSNGITCIECKELVEPDHEARNGVVHYFAGPMTPHRTNVIRRQHLLEHLSSTPTTTSFAESIPNDLKMKLRGSKECGWYTVFAPHNDVWDKVKRDYGEEQARTIAANHIHRRGLYCLGAIISRIDKFGPTFADGYHTVDVLKNGTRIIRAECGDWAKVLRGDFMAGNGVVHHIDKALIPLKGLSLEKAIKASCLKGKNRPNNKWIQYMKECDLRMRPNRKYAVLIPTRKAFDWWQKYEIFQKYYKKFQTDQDFRCRLIRFHIFAMTDQRASALQYQWLQQYGYLTNNIDQGRRALWEVDYFMKYYWGSQLYFHYSPLCQFRSYPFQGGSIYYIDRVNMIPEQQLKDILKSRTDFSIHNGLTVKANFDNDFFKPNTPLNLYLVVRDGGYSDSLKKDMSKQWWNYRNYLLLHYVQLYLWGGDIGYFDPGSRHRFMSGAGKELIFDREKDGVMYIGYKGLKRNLWPKVVEWNIYAIDGMIWVLDRPLPCNKLCKQKLLEKEIWKVMSFACWQALAVRRGAKGREMDPWLLSVDGDKCFSNFDVPKKETSTHEE